MVSLFIDYPQPFGSFRWPVDPPGIDPNSEPRVCVGFNEAWLPYILGCLLQLQLPTTWCNSTDADKILVIKQSEKLFDMFQNHYLCVWQHTFDFSVDCYLDVWGPPPGDSGYGAHCDLTDQPGWSALSSPNTDLFDIHTLEFVSGDATITDIEFTADTDQGGDVAFSWCTGIVPSGPSCDTFLTHTWENFELHDQLYLPPDSSRYLHITGPAAGDGFTVLGKLVIKGVGTDPWPNSPV
jgi:hypothetical protein